MSYEDKKTRKSRRAGKTKQELLDLFYQMAYRTERTGKLEDGCFVDLMVCSHCNLNCAGCDHYAALQQPYFVDIDTLEDQLIKLKETLPQIKILSLWGGEALLHPNFLEVCQISKKIFPDIDIVIGSNGILIDSLSEEILNFLSDNNIGFQISRYVMDGKPIVTDEEKLKEKNIHYSFTEHRNFFSAMTANPAGTEDENQWYTCTRCNMPMFTYKDYKLYKCAFGCCSTDAFKTLDINIPEIEDLDFLNLKIKKYSQKDIFEFVFKPSNKCKYCRENYLNNGFVHPITTKNQIGQFLFDYEEYFLYDFEEYLKFMFNDECMRFMKQYKDDIDQWDTIFNPILDNNIKNRYYNCDYDAWIEINKYNYRENLDLLDSLIISNKDICFYIILNDLPIFIQKQYYEKIWSKYNYDVNFVILKTDYNYSLKDIFSFIYKNSYSNNIILCNDLKRFDKKENYKKQEILPINSFESVNLFFTYYLHNNTTYPNIILEEKDILQKIYFDFLKIINQSTFNEKLYNNYINDNNYTNELCLSFKIVLLAKIENKFKQIKNEEFFNDLAKILYSSIKNKHYYFTFFDTNTFTLGTLELKVLSYLYDNKILNILNTYEKEIHD